MTCKSCSAYNLQSFSTEIAIHFPHLENLDRRHIFIFPKISICLNCGHAEFEVPEDELRVLAEDNRSWEYPSASNF
jgi:hypothetical protein